MKKRIVGSLSASLGLALLITGCMFLGNLNPIASFTVTPGNGTSPLSVDLDAAESADPDGTIDQYLWDFGDGQTASAIIPTITHIFTNVQSFSQVFTTILTVTDNEGATGTAVRNITVNP